MEHHHVYTQPSQTEIRVTVSDRRLDICEGDVFIRTTGLPNVKELDSYLEGFFAGAAYQQSEIRDLRRGERRSTTG
jgi:hypothetical protein